MSSVEIVDQTQKLLQGGLQDLAVQDQNKKASCTEAADKINRGCESNSSNSNNHHGVCAICLNSIMLQETALVKGCEHAYCVTCILKWASCKNEPTCPQCKNPFEFLDVHRALDGSIHDYMFEESVCLLLRASWFKPLVVVEREVVMDEEPVEYFYDDDDEEEDLDDVYLGSSSSLRIGNRRWGDNGYVRGGRQEARPIYRPNVQDSGAAGPSRRLEKESTAKEAVGRRAKRALKREAAIKAAAEKHEQRLVRLGLTKI